jgi:xanthine/uracil permease
MSKKTRIIVAVFLLILIGLKYVLKNTLPDSNMLDFVSGILAGLIIAILFSFILKKSGAY